MNKEENEGWPIGPIVVVAVIVVIMCFISYLMVDNAINTETVIVEGKIVDTEFYVEKIGGMMTRNILKITMDDGTVYDVLILEDSYDFTVNSKLIMKLSKGGQSDVWTIHKLIKVPDGSD